MVEELRLNFKTALELYDTETKAIPKLLHPFLQKVGLASLVGTSDSGKSTFLRQLSLAIALQQDTFLGFRIEGTTNKVLYISTEDDPSSVSFNIRRQVNRFHYENDALDKSLLKNLEFLFETENLLNNLKLKLEKEPVDLIVIDAFTDVFTKELNSNIQVRQFLNDYDKLAKAHNCLILFLHHIGKSTMKYAPSKDSIIGSQAFEAKMRAVLELRPNKYNAKLKDLWVLKANFLENKFKEKSIVLEMDENMIFNNTGKKSDKNQNSKKNNQDLINEVLKLHKAGYSVRQIEDQLKDTEYKIGKSTISEIIKNNSKSLII